MSKSKMRWCFNANLETSLFGIVQRNCFFLYKILLKFGCVSYMLYCKLYLQINYDYDGASKQKYTRAYFN